MRRHVAALALAAVALSTIAASGRIRPPAIADELQCTSGDPCVTWINGGYGTAIKGRARRGIGVAGITFNPGFGDGGIGVAGIDQTTSGGGDNYGVLGESTDGVGVAATSKLFDAVHATAQNGIAVNAFGKIGVLGQASDFPAVWGLSLPGSGVIAQGGGTDSGGFVHPALGIVTQSGTGDDVDACSVSVAPCTTNNSVFRVDQKGDVIITGQIYTAGQCSDGCTKVPGQPGRRIISYAPRETSPTMEDFGEAELVGGSAVVALDRTLASVIDRSRPYLVFLTPDGDTRGLYVAQKTASGFVVREVQGGRSTLSFDYRIVARPLDADGGRLPSVSSSGPAPNGARFARAPRRSVGDR